jgi:hypothetical protein
LTYSVGIACRVEFPIVTIVVIYFVGNTEVTKEEYDNAMNEYLKVLSQEDVVFEFIPYEDWKTYTEEQKSEALLKALNA